MECHWSNGASGRYATLVRPVARPSAIWKSYWPNR